jgi:hypothetical protein
MVPPWLVLLDAPLHIVERFVLWYGTQRDIEVFAGAEIEYW